MRHPLLLCLTMCGLLFSSACSTPNDPATRALPRSFDYVGQFEPSFLEHATFAVRSQQGTGQLRFTRYHRPTPEDTLRYAVFADSVALTLHELREFFAALDSVPLLRMKTGELWATDGIWVQNEVEQDGARNAFGFQSPRKAREPAEHRLVEAVLGLARRKFRTVPQRDYFERLAEYFDFGLPCAITATHPFEVRVHGVVYDKYVADGSLPAFLQQLPTGQPVLMDLTNSPGMAYGCFPALRRFLRANPRVFWVPSAAAAEDLQAMGVEPGHLAATLAQGRALCKAAR
ncbi:hypothetical protein [Hymenobacter lapidiphilus]|uniref:Uncharacterized protein n=1 Tax=Hymenobacter lapidiphilus TaxID=2608003 RepID=A0A7Y7U7A0_9BACT|nr:hypothetical protein [Hymenobacter lapidiphilus]NVO32310.1 hypothetical protein [Hymenobacter lapidiphilus]